MPSPPGARLFLEQDMTETAVESIAAGSAAVYSARCPDKETPNEDAAALIPIDSDSGVLVVADGVGGFRAGEQASKVAVRAVQSAMTRAAEDGLPMRDGILNGIEEANRKVTDLGLGAATTLAIAEIQNHVVRPYHVGDSLILITGGRGKVKLQTVSHSPVGFAVESGLLDESDAMHHEDRYLVSNLIGTADMRIEIGSTQTLAPRDTLLMASDGLFDNLHTEEIVDRLRQGRIDEAARLMASEAVQRMTQPRGGQPSNPDDITFVVYRPRQVGELVVNQ